MECCRECGGPLVCTEAEYVCACCGLVSNMPILLPGIQETLHSYVEPENSCALVEYMVYSLGFEENKVTEVTALYNEYVKHLDKKNIHKKMETVCALLIFTTAIHHFDTYCNHFDLDTGVISKLLIRIRNMFKTPDKHETVSSLITTLCQKFKVSLSKIPSFGQEVCNSLQTGENFIAACAMNVYGKVSIKQLAEELNVSKQGIYRTIREFHKLPKLRNIPLIPSLPRLA